LVKVEVVMVVVLVCASVCCHVTRAGPLNNATYALWQWLEEHKSNLDFIADCLEPPASEPHWAD
jgi:hypothetical protein